MSTYFWNRHNVSWPFRCKPSNGRTVLTTAVCSVKGLRCQVIWIHIYVLHNIDECLCNNFRHGKAISITYSECVFVVLVIQQSKRMRCIILSSVAFPVLPYFPPYLINGLIFGENLNIKCELIFCTIFDKTFIILRKIQRKFAELLPCGVWNTRTDGRKKRVDMTKLIVSISSFANALKMSRYTLIKLNLFSGLANIWFPEWKQVDLFLSPSRTNRHLLATHLIYNFRQRIICFQSNSLLQPSVFKTEHWI